MRSYLMKVRANLAHVSVIFSPISRIYIVRVKYLNWYLMDKTTGHHCPRCGLESLNIYYEEGSDLQLGVHCQNCGLKGYFMNGRLVQLATA